MGQLKNPPPENHDPEAEKPSSDDDQASALAAFGLVASSPLPTVDAFGIAWLWPENLPHWRAWCSVQTQWRHASGGMGVPKATGLDYSAVTAWLQANGYRPGRRGSRSLPAALYAIQACEEGALQGMDQQRAQPHRH